MPPLTQHLTYTRTYRSPAEVYNFFVGRVRTNLHLVICLRYRIHPLHPPFQSTLSTHPPKPPFQRTLSAQLFNAPSQSALPLNTIVNLI